MDPLAFLQEEDPVTASVQIAIARRYMTRRKELDDYLANEIINRLGQAMK
jgi:hypothetical protein